jgi:hypothetical protein
MSAPKQQVPPPAETDEFKAEDESLTTNKTSAILPLMMGEGKTSIRWLSPIYGQRVVEIKSSTGGKGGK